MINLDVEKVVSYFIPEKVEDTSQKITYFKLTLGAATGYTLIIGAFLTLRGPFQVVMEEFSSLKVSNATIMIVLGVAIVLFTLTRIGVKNKENTENK